MVLVVRGVAVADVLGSRFERDELDALGVENPYSVVFLSRQTILQSLRQVAETGF